MEVHIGAHKVKHKLASSHHANAQHRDEAQITKQHFVWFSECEKYYYNPLSLNETNNERMAAAAHPLTHHHSLVTANSMDFAEGSAFEDFVKMVEDAKYKEAILDSDVPRPDRKFPSPPRGFNYQNFVEEHDIHLATLCSEPLGRFFLRQASVAEEERNMLNFAQSLCGLKRMDPQGYVQMDDIFMLCNRHQVHLESTTTTPEREHSTTTTATAAKHSKKATGASTSSFSAQATKRLIQGGRQHSQACIQLNAQAWYTVETKMELAYERLMHHHKKLYCLYLQLKAYSLQPLTEYSIKYHRALGVGAFGIVYGCIVSCLGTMLAMKIMNKKKIKAKNAMSQVTAERDALEALAMHPSPYCLRLRYSFETPEAYHFLLPLAIAGDLQFHLRTGPFSLERARCYSAQVALGLGHIHSLGMIIRDLKPRNILLTSSGICQISDFGLAMQLGSDTGSTKGMEKIKGRAGTEGYWSPEVINGELYGVDADWWSFGACLFEFLAGVCPFSAKHAGVKKRNDATRRGEVKFTANFPECAKPLVLALLDLNIDMRCIGADNVLDDAKWEFWEEFDLDLVRRNEMPAPWLPERGKIYAASQVEIQENDKEEDRHKIKLLPQDAISFDPFVDEEGHQTDICKVLDMLHKDRKLETALQSMSKSCCIA